MNSKRLLILVLSIPAVALAGFKLPSKIFEVGDLEKAQVEAAAKGKPIAFLFSNKDSTCPLCSDASSTMIRELGSKTVMVYVRNVTGLPQSVIKALTPGQYIPKIAVLDDRLETTLGTVTYEAVKSDSRAAFREVEKAIRDYKKAE
ncbi:hypothetical protein [Prosthecobacter sp.]|uniref:hypothetical protein n=1 Tax=Prosthecobacter sp. TaxID=1965333 RepID=UPI002AB8CA2D|nr:hypothetical protein [Prosthecobacter sp.]MDZ4403799.1 hypothetical protein [Prosthecobacter sp.]